MTQVNSLGCFKGDWQDEIQAIISSKVAHQKFSDNWERDEDQKGIADAGGNPDMVVYRGLSDFSDYPSLSKMKEFFKMDPCKAKLHLQYTGESLPVHVDAGYGYVSDFDKKDITRIMIMLQDWEPGQFIFYGEQIYYKWKAGDIYNFDWQNLPHGSANASLRPRPMLVVTGIMTKHTKKILETKIDEKI